MRAALAAATIFALAVTLASSAAGDTRASRAFDGTYSCQAGFVGGLHQVGLFTRYATSEGSSQLRAFAHVSHNFVDGLGYLSSDLLTIHRGLCATSKARVKLTTTGLRGGAAPPLGMEKTCETPRRVLLRVRATFTTPPNVELSRRYGYPLLSIRGSVVEAAVAVATTTGKPIAYLSVTGAEKSRFFTRPTCKED